MGINRQNTTSGFNNKSSSVSKVRDGFMEYSRRGGGMLPSPALLESYEEIAPGSIEKFIEMVGKEQEYRHQMLDKQLGIMKITNIIGHLMMAAMVLAILWVAVLLVKDYNQPMVASMVAAAGFGFLSLLKLMQSYQNRSGQTHNKKERDQRPYDNRGNEGRGNTRKNDRYKNSNRNRGESEEKNRERNNERAGANSFTNSPYKSNTKSANDLGQNSKDQNNENSKMRKMPIKRR